MTNDPRIEELKTLLPRCMLHEWVRLGSRLARVLHDRHHQGRHDALIDRLLDRARASTALRERRAHELPRLTYPADLPITARKDEIVAAIRNHQVVVVAGETGSGKTTQIPKMCLEAGLGIEAKIGCTQPRRVAALSISRRVAEELGVEWGRQVGSKIRFDDRSSEETYIKFVTDGMLLAELQGDPDLSEYNALIVDEAHERSLNIDFLLGHLQGLLARRQDLKLLITSATIDTAVFSRAFGNAPVIEVSGRMFPVEVVYAPLDSESEERGDQTYIDAAVRAAEQSLYRPGSGDVLIFMPGERDIRETSEQLEGRFGKEIDVIPLYGRLSAGDQQRVFARSSRTKVVVATNIAETSLTIPGIRYVIDSGLARISRYSPKTRTRRLPVEPISRSSARQRQGRAGRVQEGVCIRLYSQEDFEERPAETQPEIQRANLAEVILRMKAFHLGDIETFPFLNPPAPAAIRAGYALLHELGALDESRELTPLGRDLARLPIDPTLGRMLLQSQREHATHELLIIAAGLSIQDPRERPVDKKEEATTAHKRFTDPASDFLTLLNLWNAVHDEWESLRTQNQRRRFCRTHFLSYTRMREWQDLYAQLHEALEELGSVRLNESSADYGAIHRSVLAGLLGHVAQRKERNLYRGAGNRELTVFPGSALHARGEPPRRSGARDAKPASAPKPASQPEWIVAGEIVETSQLFVRTLAGIDPSWIVDLAPHLVKVSHRGPHWSRTAGRVLVEEVATLHGLEVRRRKVAYGNLEPRDATAIFIRSALVEEDLLPGLRPDEDEEERSDVHSARRIAFRPGARVRPTVPAQYRFLEHNRKVRQKLEDWQTRLRRHEFGDLEEALFTFYATRLEGVSSLDELNRFLREQADPEVLFVKEADLTGGREVNVDSAAFPESVEFAGQSVPVTYAYAPGEEWDGVTLRLPMELAKAVSAAALDWAVPSLRAEMVAELLASLPKTHRRALQPFAPKVEEIVRDLAPIGPTLLHDLGRFIRDRYGVAVAVGDWRPDNVPAHLRPRLEVLGTDRRKPIAVGRDLPALRAALDQAKPKTTEDSGLWRRAAERWERPAVSGWTFADLPERVEVGVEGGVPVVGWLGLKVEDHAVSVRLFRSLEGSKAASGPGLRRLVELALSRELGWLERDLRGLQRFASAYASIGSIEELQETAFDLLRRHILPDRPLPALREALFRENVEAARAKIPGLAQQFMDRLGGVLELSVQVRRKLGPELAGVASGASSSATRASSPGRGASLKDFSQLEAWVAPSGSAAATSASGTRSSSAAPAGGSPHLGTAGEELRHLAGPRFLARTTYERLPHLVRYLKALLVRVERAALNPAKDRERMCLVAPYLAALARVDATPEFSEEGRAAANEFRVLVEEYKVSVFAQELGTAVPVSPKRLDAVWDRVRLECR